MLDQATADIIEWIRVFPPAGLYIVFFVVAYGENLVPPVPGDILVVFAGYLSAVGIIDFLPVYLLTTVASVLGFMSVYAVGSYFGSQIARNPEKVRIFRFLKFKDYKKAQLWMNKWGQGVIIANRFLPGMRSIISVVAGISHTPVLKTIFSSTISSVLWNFVLIGSGWMLHENWKVIGHYLSLYSRFILILAILLLSGYAANYVRKKMTKEKINQEN